MCFSYTGVEPVEELHHAVESNYVIVRLSQESIISSLKTKTSALFLYLCEKMFRLINAN